MMMMMMMMMMTMMRSLLSNTNIRRLYRKKTQRIQYTNTDGITSG